MSEGRARPVSSGLLAATLLLSCGDDASPPVDAGRDAPVADAGSGDAGVTEVVAPTPPTFTPCPAGWRERLDPDGITVCDPWPESGPSECALGEAQRPGEPGCTPLAPPCPASGFPEDLPPGATVVYVRAGETGGDGSAGAPFGRVSDAVAVAPSGAVVAVAPGTYDEAISVRTPLSIVGACFDTILRNTGVGPVLVSWDVAFEARHLRVSSTTEGVWVSGGTATLRGLLIDDVAGVSIEVRGGAVVDVEDTAILGSRDVPIDLQSGQVSFRRGYVVGAQSDGLRFYAGRFFVSDSVFRDIGVAGTLGQFALGGSSLAELTMQRTVVTESRSLSIQSIHPGAIRLEDVVLEGRPPSAEKEAPTAFALFGGGLGELTRVRMERPRGLALAATGGSTLVATDLLVRDVIQVNVGLEGRGMELGEAATAELRRVRFERARSIGVFATGTGTRIDAEDLAVVDTAPLPSGRLGRALQAQLGASIVATRALVSGNTEASVVAGGEGARIELLDVEVLGTLPRPCAPACAPAGIGVGAYFGGVAQLTRFRVAGSALANVQLALDGEVDLSVGEVSGAPVGVNLQVDGYDVERLDDRVVYRDNGTNLDSSELPVPDSTL